MRCEERRSEGAEEIGGRDEEVECRKVGMRLNLFATTAVPW